MSELTFKQKKELIELEFEKKSKTLALQHDYKLQQIRLESANRRKLEEYKYGCQLDVIQKRGKKY